MEMAEFEYCSECDGRGVLRKAVFNGVEKWTRKLLVAFAVLAILGIELNGFGISFPLVIAWFPIYYAGWILLGSLIITRIVKDSRRRKLTDAEWKQVKEHRKQPQSVVTPAVTHTIVAEG